MIEQTPLSAIKCKLAVFFLTFITILCLSTSLYFTIVFKIGVKDSFDIEKVYTELNDEFYIQAA